MSIKIKWGILGTGMIAKKFAKDLNATELGELHATASRAQETANLFASEYGGKGFSSYESLINNSEIDAIYNPLPNGLHAEWSIKAMNAGKHVLCEKPMARNISEVEEMFKVSEHTGKVLVEGFMYRAHPGIQKLIETVRNGALGKIKLIRSNFSFTREVMDSDARYKIEHAGGGLMDVGCYCVNLARAIVGSEPTETSCIAHIHEKGVDDYAAGLLNFNNETLMTFTCGMTVMNNWTTYISGDEGEIQIDAPWFCDGTFKLTKGDEFEVIEAKTDKPMYALEAESFAKAVAGEDPWITKEDSLGNMLVLDKLRKQSGVSVPF